MRGNLFRQTYDSSRDGGQADENRAAGEGGLRIRVDREARRKRLPALRQPRDSVLSQALRGYVRVSRRRQERESGVHLRAPAGRVSGRDSRALERRGGLESGNNSKFIGIAESRIHFLSELQGEGLLDLDAGAYGDGGQAGRVGKRDVRDCGGVALPLGRGGRRSLRGLPVHQPVREAEDRGVVLREGGH